MLLQALVEAQPASRFLMRLPSAWWSVGYLPMLMSSSITCPTQHWLELIARITLRGGRSHHIFTSSGLQPAVMCQNSRNSISPKTWNEFWLCWDDSVVCCLQVLVPGGEKQVMLESLQPDARYSILVTAEYHNREGGSGSAQGKTGESNKGKMPRQLKCNFQLRPTGLHAKSANVPLLYPYRRICILEGFHI